MVAVNCVVIIVPLVDHFDLDCKSPPPHLKTTDLRVRLQRVQLNKCLLYLESFAGALLLNLLA